MTDQQRGLLLLIKSALTGEAVVVPTDFDIHEAFDTAKTAYDNAVADYELAVAAYSGAKAAYDDAEKTYNEKKDAYDKAAAKLKNKTDCLVFVIVIVIVFVGYVPSYELLFGVV